METSTGVKVPGQSRKGNGERTAFATIVVHNKVFVTQTFLDLRIKVDKICALSCVFHHTIEFFCGSPVAFHNSCCVRGANRFFTTGIEFCGTRCGLVAVGCPERKSSQGQPCLPTIHRPGNLGLPNRNETFENYHYLQFLN